MKLRFLAYAFGWYALSAYAGTARYVVSELGAVGDGKTINTVTLQAAIDRCASAGGGVVVIPTGTFLSGALFFKPGVDLHLERGAVLKSTTEKADFPPLYTRWEGIERYWTAAFLNFVGVEHVTVDGEGTIDGSGDAWAGYGQRPRPVFDRKAYEAARAAAAATPLPKPSEVYPTPLPTTATVCFAPDPSRLPRINAAGVPLPSLFGTLAPPRTLVFQNCRDVRIAGVTVKNQARWGFVFLYCEHVVADHLTARAEHYIPSSDSMDIDSCRDVRVTSCDFECNDDCISIKSGKDEDGRRVNRPCEDILVEKTRFGYGHGGVAIGSETSGGIRRVEIRDCVAEAGNWAPVRIKTQPTRGAVVEDIVYRNFELRDVKQAFEFDLEWNMRIATPDAERCVPVVRGIRLIAVHGTAGSVGRMHGLPDSPVQQVTFEDCRITASTGFVIDHARDIATAGLKLSVTTGDPIIWK
jgi:polygalacturonase